MSFFKTPVESYSSTPRKSEQRLPYRRRAKKQDAGILLNPKQIHSVDSRDVTAAVPAYGRTINTTPATMTKAPMSLWRIFSSLKRSFP